MLNTYIKQFGLTGMLKDKLGEGPVNTGFE